MQRGTKAFVGAPLNAPAAPPCVYFRYSPKRARTQNPMVHIGLFYLSSLHSHDGRQLTLFLLSGGPRWEEVRPPRRQTSVRPLPHQVLRQLLRRVPPTHPCGVKGTAPSVYSVSWMHLSPVPLATRSSTIRAATGTKSVSAAQSATRTWPRSRSAPKTSASCAGSAARKRPLHGAMAATNLYWPVGLTILEESTKLFSS